MVQTPDQHYYLSKLLGYDYIIRYRQGTSNTMADALSRCDTPFTSNLYLLTTPTFGFLPILVTENKLFPDLQELHIALEKQ